MSVRAIFMGSDEFSVPVLRAMLDHGPGLSNAVDTVAVVTQPDRPTGRGRHMKAGPVKEVALEHELSVLQPARLRAPEAVDTLRQLEPELIVVASYGQILPGSVLALPKHGCLNLHPSLLPLYRGPSPISAPLLSGDRVTGTSLMLMAEAMDAGPVLGQREVEIGPDETAGELEMRLSVLSGALLVEMLPAWLAGVVEPVAQDESAATYTAKLSKADGELDWSKPAELLARVVRAYNPWPGAFTTWRGAPLRVLRARAIEGEGRPGEVLQAGDGGLTVGCGEGLLLVTAVQAAGSKQMSAEDFARGRTGVAGSVLGI